MTQVAEPGTPHAAPDHRERVHHWIGGRSVAGHVRSPRARSTTRRPAARRARSTSPRSRRSTRPSRAAAGGLPGLAGDVALASGPRSCSGSGTWSTSTARDIAAHLTAEHGKVPSDALGEIARGLENLEFATRHPAAAQGRLQRAGLDRRRRLPDPPAARRRRRDHARSTSRRWSRCGCSPTRSPAATRSSSSRPRRTRRRRSSWPSCSRRPACPTASSTSSTATRSRSTRSSSTPTIAAVSFVGSTPIARYIYETGTKHGKRVQALGGAKNHMIVLPDADIDMAADAAVSAGYGSAGERCMAIASSSRSATSADPLVEAIKSAAAEDQGRAGHAIRRPRWARSSPASTATRSPRTSTAAPAQGATVVADGREHPLYDESDGFFLGVVAHRQRHAGDGLPTATRSSGRSSTVVRVETYDEAVKLVNDNPYGNGTAIFTRDGGAARQFQFEVERRDGRDQRADPGAGRLLQLRRLEELALRRPPHVRPGGRSSSTRGPRS